MGKIVDTTNFVDTSIYLKSKLSKNYFGDNYWIEGMQNKVDAAWRFAPDVVDIHEQRIEEDDLGFIKANPHYYETEIRLNSAYDEKGQKLSDDYKNILFKNIDHPMRLGTKYYFDVHDFKNSDPKYPSTWLSINFDTTQLTANTLVRRCNASLGFLIKDRTEEYYEPAILDYDPKYTINRMDNVLNIVKSEIYITVQYNEYTKNIKVNDRFIVGALDFNDLSNNAVFKAKEVFKFGALSTGNPNSVPLMTIAFDRDVVNIDTDLIKQDPDGTMHYIADYYIKKQSKVNNKEVAGCYLQLSPDNDVIYQGEEQTYTCTLYSYNGTPIDTDITFNTMLEGTNMPDAYYETAISGNSITIKNIKRFYKSNLLLSCSVDDSYNVEPLKYFITLGEKL